jgi:hypothetical protein
MSTNAKQQQAEEINWGSVDQDAQDRMSLQLPLVLWFHGKAAMKQLGDKNINYTGGFFLSQDAAGAGTEIELWTPQSFEGDKGEVPGIGTNVADIALVRSRKRWFKESNDRKEFRAWRNYEQGFRAHLQIVGFIKGFEHPVTFNFKGLLGQAIESIQREHMSKVVAILNRTSPTKGQGLPPYALWVRLKSGKHEKVGGGSQQSEATMPVIVLPPAVDLAFARSRFVGNALLQHMQELYIEAADWVREWEYAGGADVTESNRESARGASADPAINDPYGTYAPPTTPKDDEIPF